MALTKLARWYDEVDKSGFLSFGTVARTIQKHYLRIVQLMRLANLLMQKSSSSEHNSEESGTWHFSYLDYLKFMRNMTIPQDFGMIPLKQG